MATASEPQPQYKYRGEAVSILDSVGGLRQVVVDDGTPFWVKLERLKLVKPRKEHRHNIPDIGADPFVCWLLTQHIVLTGDCPPQFLTRLEAAYLEATGQEFDHDACPTVSVCDGDKSWGYSLYVHFPVPPASISIPLPTYNSNRKKLAISNNAFVLGLLALGLRFGSNKSLQTI